MPTVRDIKKRYPKLESDGAITRLLKWSPGRSYILWMVKQCHAGQEEEQVLSAVQDFHAKKQRLPTDRRDVNAFKSLESLTDFLSTISAKSKRAKKKEEAQGRTLILRTKKADAYIITSFEGIRDLGKDTKWCITNRNDWESHRDSTFVVIVDKTRKRRVRFSKFIVEIKLNRTVEPDEILERRALLKLIRRAKRSAEATKKEVTSGSSVDVTVFDEIDIDTGEYHVDGRESANAELLRILLGDGKLEGLIQKAMSEQRSHTEQIVKVSALASGRLPKKKFMSLAKMVRDENIFNYLSLFDHPMARNPECKDYLWSLRPEKIPPGDVSFLIQSHAMSIPGCVEVALDSVFVKMKVKRGSTRRRLKARKATRVSMLARIIMSPQLSKEGKVLVMDFICENHFKLKDYEPGHLK